MERICFLSLQFSVFQCAIQSLVDFHIQSLFSSFLIAIWYIYIYIYVCMYVYNKLCKTRTSHYAKPRYSTIKKFRAYIQSTSSSNYIYQAMPWSLAEPTAEQILEKKKPIAFFHDLYHVQFIFLKLVSFQNMNFSYKLSLQVFQVKPTNYISN